MTRWDPALYLRHADHRSRPFVDLVARVPGEPHSIVDLGCGPGHLTSVLRGRWPEAHVLGVDSSPEMVQQATSESTDPLASYEQADVATWSPAGPVDLVVSNALFQWVPDQLAHVRRISEHVAPGGTFALQVPNNYRGASHRLLQEISSRDPYAAHARGLAEDRGTEAETYLELFLDLGWEVDAWGTTYLHVLQGDDPVFSWISGTGARPVLQALPDGLREDFVAEYKEALREAYPRRSFGTVLPFQRVFAVATRPAAG